MKINPEIGWSSEHTYTRHVISWKLCPYCLGQRRLYLQKHRVWIMCPKCIGIGEIAT